MDSTGRISWLLSIAACVAATAVLPACDRIQQPTPHTTPDGAAQAPSPQASVNNGTRGAEGADANTRPMQPMTKEEESGSMPQPGQANDHSTVAKDKQS